MNEQIFPPSPNWYHNKAFACDSTGTLAYGSRNSLVVIKSTNNICDKYLSKVEIVPIAHNDKVTAVVFSPQSSDNTLYNCIATSGDDGMVKVWNLQTMAPILANVSHGNGTKVSCLDWSVANSDLIISVDDSHNIVCWDLPRNSTRTFSVGKLSASALSCCPHNKDLVAIGCRSGLVCIVNIQGRGKILFRMRGHDSDVVSLAWCPVGYNIFDSFKSKNEKSVESKELVLASAAKEKAVFLWRANSDGRYELALYIPSHLMIGQKSNKVGAADMNWVSLCWPQAYTLICSTRLGRIIAWDLKACYLNKFSKNEEGGDAATTRVWRLIHSSHNRIVFSIVTSHKSFHNGLEFQETTNWRQSCADEQVENPLVIWSSSQDRFIVGYDLSANKEVMCIPTIGGIVYCIAASPIDPNRIAFGVSDGIIRVWNLSSSSAFDVNFLWQKVKGKVTNVAWHPTQESRLAFGTSEGRVGIFDMLNPSKPPVLLRPYHTKSLYSLVWGPALFGRGEGDGPTETKYTLYSCGEGDVVQYDIHNPEAEAKNFRDLPQLNTALKKSSIRTHLAWKPDNSILALGNEDGSVQLVTPTNSTVLHTIYAHKNLVQSLAWHPEGTATDTGYSPCQHWLAVASKKSPIKVYNLTTLIESESGEVECVATFSQHKQCVVDMCWSPHVSGQLLSVSFDETAQIWDVLQQQPIGNYSAHAGVLHSGCWSPLDPDLVLTGSADSTVRVWRISNLDHTVPFDKKKNAAKNCPVQLSTKMNEVSSPEKDEFPSNEAAVSSSPMPTSGVAAQDHEIPVPKSGRQKARSYFPVWAQIWQGSVSNILDRCQLYLKSEDKSDTEANLLGSRTNVLELLKLEEKQHTRNGNLETIQHMVLWKGDIGETIRESAKKKKLTDWLVSVAPMVSQRLWVDTCLAYAEQLTAEGRVHKAATYLLACHKVEEAIQLFLQHHLYREALTVAKLRLSEEDPLTINIVREWSQQQILEGHYERAAECLMSVGDLPGAAEILGKRNDARCLWFAADLAHKSSSQPVTLTYAKNCITQCLLHKNWEFAVKVTSEYPELKSLAIFIFTHKTICELLTGKLIIQEPITQWIFQQFKKEYETDPKEFYDDLEKRVEQSVPDTKSKLWLAVSRDVALSSCTADEVTSLEHLVKVANMCYQFQLMHPNVFPLLQYLRWLAPQGVLEEDNVFKKESELENITFMRQSLRFYLYAGYFSWLQAEISFCGTDFIDIKDEKDLGLNRNSTSTCVKNNDASDRNEGNISLNTDTDIESEPERIACSGNEVMHVAGKQTVSQEKSEYDDSGDHKCDRNISSSKFDWKNLVVPLLTCYSNELPLEASALAYYKRKVEIKKWEQEVASLVAQQHQNSVEETKDEGNANQEQQESKMLRGLKKLDELKVLKETFEKQRISTPNPFVTYCHFSSICDILIKEKGINVLKNVSETAVKHWQMAVNDNK